MTLPVRWGGWNAPAPPVDWLVEGLLPVGAVALLSAEPGSYKSYMAVEIAVSIANGRKAMGLFPTKHGRALYIDFDGGENITRRRVAQLSPGLDLPGFGYLAGSSVGTCFEPKLWKFLNDDAPDLVIVDTLAAGSQGIDENDKRFGDVMVEARLLAQRKGTASLFLHHLNAMGGVRGSSSLRGNPDCDFRSELTNRGKVKFMCKKMKHAPALNPFFVDVTGIERGEGILANYA